jgi:hypothetical protein
MIMRWQSMIKLMVSTIDDLSQDCYDPNIWVLTL